LVSKKLLSKKIQIVFLGENMLKKISLTSLILLSLVLMLKAQSSTGTLTGSITDSTNSLVAGADIQVVNVETNAVVTATTNEEGFYKISSLQPAKYRITIEKQGFRKTILENITVLTAQTVTANATLEIGSTNETVEVKNEAALLTSDSATLNTTVESETLKELPFPDRTALGAIFLAAGVQGDPQYAGGIQSETPGIFTQPTTPGGSLSVSGSRPGTSSILIDGSDITLTSYPRVGVTFSGNTQREITIQQNGLPAQYGRTGGGIINQSTRSGGNKFRGTLSWKHTDPFFQARRYNSTANPAYHQNQFAGVLSGPVFLPRFGEGTPYLYNGKERTFFFVSVEPLRQSDVQFSRARLVTPDELAGRFNNSLELLNQTILRNQGIEAALAAPRVAGLSYQFVLNSQGFSTGRQLATSQYVAIANNDLSRQLANNPVAQAIFRYLPSPSIPSQYYNYYRSDGLYASDGTNANVARGVVSDDNRFSFRIDHKLTKNDQIAFRYTYVPVTGVRFNYLGPDSPGDQLVADSVKSRNLTLTETHIFGTSRVNEFRASYTRANQFRGPNPAALSQDYGASLGLLPAARGQGFPTFGNFPGATTLGSGTQSNGPGTSLDVNFSVADDFSLTSGNHNFKLGGETRFLQLNRQDTSGLFGGAYSFAPALTANPSFGNTGIGLATFLLGSISGYTVKASDLTYHYRWHYYAAYFQDDWRIRRNLTLNLGLRYNLETPRTEKNNLQGSFDPNVTGTLNGLPVQGAFVFSGQNGRGRGLWKTNFKGFEPRLGMAYQPFSNITLRASYALIHTPLTGLGNNVIPDLNAPTASYANGNGGTNPAAYANYVTNPLSPPGASVSLIGPLFTFPSSVNLPYVDPSDKVPYVQLYSASIQYQIMKNAVVEAAYSGQRGVHLFSTPTNINIPSLSSIVQQINLGGNFNGRPFTNRYTGQTESLYETLRPYQQFYNNAIDTAYDRRASSSYNALYLTFKQRLTAGLTTTMSYTWAKSIDDFSSNSADAVTTDIFTYSRPQNPENLKPERSVSTFDIPHRFTIGYNYQLPIGDKNFLSFRKGFLNYIFSGISTSGIATIQAGFPLQIRLGSGTGNQSTVNGYFFSTLAGGVPGSGGMALQDYFIRPNIVPGVSLINPNWRSDPTGLLPGGGYVNPAAFAVPGSVGNPQLGNAPRTLPYLRNPTSTTFDTSFTKNFKLGKDRARNFKLRMDVINVLNKAVFVFPANNNGGLFTSYNTTTRTFVTDARFGKLQASDTVRPRTFRFSLEFNF
jgi:hypothetical protein